MISKMHLLLTPVKTFTVDCLIKLDVDSADLNS